jgi:tRNA pseudouridine55 synthase
LSPPRSGIVVCSKPAGKTSHGVVREVSRLTGISKAGHTGTLDKFAEGVLPILLGSYTRLSRFVLERDKRYEAFVEFGRETDTLDPEGRVIATGPIPTRGEIEAVLPSFVGEIEQAPPAYSAIHLNGRRAYELALAGAMPDMPARKIRVDTIKLLDYDDSVARLVVACGKGTYIRSLARDIAHRLGTHAHLRRLIRLESAGFGLDRAIPLADIAPDSVTSFTPDSVSAIGLESVRIDGCRLSDFRNGKALAPEFFSPAIFMDDTDYMVFSPEGLAVGVVRKHGEALGYELVLGEG